MKQHRNTLNKGQITVLELLYKFRFGSSDLLAEYFEKPSGVYLYKRLNILIERGLVGKRYDSSYRLRGLPAAYYLRPDGYRMIQEIYDESVPRAALAYKSLGVSEDYVQHCLRIFAIYNTFKKRLGDKVKFFTKSDMEELELPSTKPDAYLLLDDSKPFLLDICISSQQFMAERVKLRSYDSWIEERGYDSNFAVPTLLIVCDTSSIVKKIQSVLAKYAYDSSAAHITMSELLNGSDSWHHFDDPDKISAFAELS